MSPRELLRVWLNLQCVDLMAGGRLAAIPGSVCDEVELFLAVRYAGGVYEYYYRSDVQVRGLNFDDIEAATAALNPGEVRREMTYYFPVAPGIPAPNVIFLGDTQDTFDTFWVSQNNDWISRAWSIRRSETGAEIAVETKAEYRRRGLAKQVTAAWANYQLAKGKIAIYSHRSGNSESRALAHSVGAELIAETISYQETA